MKYVYMYSFSVLYNKLGRSVSQISSARSKWTVSTVDYIHYLKACVHQALSLFFLLSSHDNGRLVSGGEDKIVFLMDVGTGQPIRKFRGHLSVNPPL